MRHFLLVALVVAMPARADDAKWSVGQTTISPEYVFCKSDTDCMSRTVKVVDLDQQPTGPTRRPEALASKQEPLEKSVIVRFRLASSVLDEKARTDIRRLVEAAEPHQKFLVTGMTDKLGSARFNKRLARSRASAVRKYLVRNDVPAGRIALSATCCVDFPPTDNPPARRAVIRLSDPEKTR